MAVLALGGISENVGDFSSASERQGVDRSKIDSLFQSVPEMMLESQAVPVDKLT